LQALERAGTPAALCTVVRTRGSVPRHPGSRMLVLGDGSTEGTIGGGEMEGRVVGEALDVIRTGAARLVRYALVDPRAGDPGVCGGELEVFVEPVTARPALVVIGGGHVGRALVQMGSWLGFRTVLCDDRAEFCTPDAVPGADEYLPISAAELARRFQFQPDTSIVLPTRGAPVDVEALPLLLDVPHAYLGVIGSRRRWATVVQELAARGIPPETLARVHAPMGLELGAETPEEIAMSVLAEIVMLRRGGTGRSMRWMGRPEDA
jgi:xanthine dehydrogenase accessory factor